MAHVFSSLKAFVWGRGALAQSLYSESESHSVVPDSLQPHGLYSPWNSPGQNTGAGSISLLQGIFPTQGSKPGLPHCRRILYQLSHQGTPGFMAMGLISGFSNQSSCLALIWSDSGSLLVTCASLSQYSGRIPAQRILGGC